MKKTMIETNRVVLAILLSLIMFLPAAAQEPPSNADSLATRNVIADQLSAFNDGDYSRAYSHAAPNIQQYFPTIDRFTGMVQRGYGALYKSDSHFFGRSISSNGQIHQEVIVTDEAGKQWQAVYTLRQLEDGSWKITGVKLNPYKGASV